MGIRTVKAQKLQIEAIDPRIEKVAELARTDAKYQQMLHHTEQETEDKYLEEESDLKKMGTGRKHLGIYVDKNGNKLLVKNSEEIIIPELAREEVLQELHATHLSSDGMKRLARGKFHWYGMGKDIEKLARECKNCQENAPSKLNIPGRRNKVVPTSLETGAAGELLSTDFGQFGRSNLLIVRDCYSGLLRVFLSPDKTMKAASKGIER